VDVREFVKESLLQIALGVKDANSEFKKLGIDAEAQPSFSRSKTPSGSSNHGVADTEKVNFDIAVTAESRNEVGSEKTGGVGLSVFSADLTGSSSAQNSTSNASRLQFAIWLKLHSATGSP
jgi:hypothetical protein